MVSLVSGDHLAADPFTAVHYSSVAQPSDQTFMRPRCTRFSTFSHPFSIHLTNARVNLHLHSFIPFTGKLWNSLPDSVSPPSYELNS